MELTWRCNAHCRFCSYWKTPNEPQFDMPFSTAKKFIDGVSKMGKKPRLEILGGEPTLHPHIKEVISYCKKKQVWPSIVTNGFMFADYDFAKRLIDSGIDSINVSLEGFKEQNDFLRGKGNYDKAIQGIKNIKKIKNVHITILSVITSKNLKILPEFFKDLHDQKLIDKCNLQALYCDFRKENGEGWWSNNPLWPTDQEMVEKGIDRLIELKEQTNLIRNSEQQMEFWKTYFKDPTNHKKIDCNIDKFFTYCACTGDILICPDMPSVGNINKNKLSDILLSENAEQRRISIRACTRLCHSRVSCFFEQLKPEETPNINRS
ncbi:MAG: radical SAM protein [archaeon]